MRAVYLPTVWAILVLGCGSCGSDRDPWSAEFDQVVRHAQEYADAPYPESAVEAGALLDRSAHELQRLGRTLEGRLDDEPDEVTARWRDIEASASEVLGALRTVVDGWPRASESEAEGLIRTVEGQRIALGRWLDEARYLATDSMRVLEEVLSDDLATMESEMDDVEAAADGLGGATGDEILRSLKGLRTEWATLREDTRRLARADDLEIQALRLHLVRDVAELRKDLALLRWRAEAKGSPGGG